MSVTLNVELTDFEDKEIVEYAREMLGMQEFPELYDFDDYEIVLYLESKGYEVIDNSGETLRENMAYKKLLENTDKIPVEEIERIVEKYKLI